jgi:cholest-4-en-3-one 26-monooxygenase
VELSEIDLLDLDTFERGVPHDWFAYLRARAPVYKHPEPSGRGFWVISKHADVRMMGHDAGTYSSAAELGGIDALTDDAEPDPAEGHMLPLMDAPRHTVYRKLVHDPFRPRPVRVSEDRIRDRAAGILNAVLAEGGCDFSAEVAGRLSGESVAELLGLPVEERWKIHRWSVRISENEHPDPKVRHAQALESFDEALVDARAIAADRRAGPRDDILTTLSLATVDGGHLDDVDLANFVVLLAVAGEQTLRHTLAHGMLAFAERPDQYDAIRHDPAAITGAVEEVLRWATPAMYFRRNVTHDTEVRGVTIREGDKVSLWYISANRDEEVFDHPFRFDVRRSPNDHLAFGHGPHFCLGVHLARLEIRIFLEELVQRVDRIEVAGAVKRLRSNAFNGITHLPLRLRAARGARPV